MKITSKQQMKAMLSAGIFGNAIRSWATYEEMVRAGYAGPVYVRSDLWSATDRRMNEVPAADVPGTAQRLEIDLKTCRFYEAPPNHLRIIQGEVCYSPDLCLTYSLLQKPLSDALHDKSVHVDGVKARIVLRHFLRPESIDWLEYLLETYDRAAVEFTEFRVPQGMLSQHLVIWEVRNF
jgi:hypothetical protein